MQYSSMLVVLAAIVTLPPRFAFSQGAADYPAKTVRVIASASPGGGADLTARMFAQKLSENLKQQFVVDNRPGAGDTIGTGLTAKSPPDGYTLMLAAPSFTIAAALYPEFTVDPIKDFTPISLSTKAPVLLVVHPALPVKSAKELIALARSKPGMLNAGITNGAIGHLACAYFVSAANIKLTFIPYKSAPQLLTDAMAGQIPMHFVNALSAMPHVKSGRLRALAVTTAERSSALSEVPTIAESGVAGYDVSVWFGWVAPAGTPAAIVAKLNTELARAIKSPEVTRKIASDGAEIVSSTPEQFAQHIAVEVPRWRKVVKELNMRVE